MLEKLIFIDNGISDKMSKEEFETFVEGYLEPYFNDNILDNVEIVSNFGKRSQEEIESILFNKKNIICNYSFYTKNSVESYNQLVQFLTLAYEKDERDNVFIDVSGDILNVIEELPRWKVNPIPFIAAINQNTIITRIKESFYQISINFHTKDLIYSLEKIDIKEKYGWQLERFNNPKQLSKNLDFFQGWLNRHITPLPAFECQITILHPEHDGMNPLTCEWTPFDPSNFDQGNMPAQGYLGTAHWINPIPVGFHAWEQNNSEFVYYKLNK